MKTKTLFAVLVWSLFCVNNALALDSLNNVGLVRSGIWYSKDPFYSGDKVRIYTLIFNGSNEDLLGEVVFEDNGKTICKGSFTASSGRSQEIWCDWTATLGDHKISARIVNPKIALIGETPRDIILQNAISGISERKVDAPPKKIGLSVEPINKLPTASATSSSTSLSSLEKDMSDGIEVVKSAVQQILPDRINREEIISRGDKIVSATPKTIRESVGKVVKKMGVEKMKEPLMLVIDFLVAAYNFIIGDPLLIVLIVIYIVWKVAKYVYRRVIWPQ